DPTPSDTSTLSLHDALPISHRPTTRSLRGRPRPRGRSSPLGGFSLTFDLGGPLLDVLTAPDHVERLLGVLVHLAVDDGPERADRDRKSTRLNSSHVKISYAV